MTLALWPESMEDEMHYEHQCGRYFETGGMSYSRKDPVIMKEKVCIYSAFLDYIRLWRRATSICSYRNSIFDEFIND